MAASTEAERRLAAQLDAFEAMVRTLAALRDRTDPDRLRELVRARRVIADQVAVLRATGAAAFAGAERQTLAGEFRSRLSVALNAMATHQADWPAVAVDDDSAAYARSAQNASAASRALIAWAREQLRTL